MKFRTALLGIPSALLLGAPAVGQTLPAPVDEWRFSVSPYLWMAGMNGTVSMPGRSASFDVDFDDVLDSFEFGYMTQFEAWKGRFGILLDGFFLLTETDFDTPRNLAFDGGTSQLTTMSLTAVGLVRAHHGDRFALDAGGGLRAWRAESEITSKSGLRPGSTDSSTTTFADPILALRAHVALADRWILNAYGDIGGFGIESDLTWQVMATVGYHISDRFTAHAGYRHMRLERSTGSLSLDVDMTGPILGITYRF